MVSPATCAPCPAAPYSRPARDSYPAPPCLPSACPVSFSPLSSAHTSSPTQCPPSRGVPGSRVPLRAQRPASSAIFAPHSHNRSTARRVSSARWGRRLRGSQAQKTYFERRVQESGMLKTQTWKGGWRRECTCRWRWR
ncbi:hypothetical protein B0H17DRAFT_1064022 [Mycena rosella]|uniref:Uncharacterized protein n=1 Tax=Mycena rosella TaxID=1033263 RepID=A0AAD7GEK3_MYCRO|nr:hypothetical protein B0H17DRAFT_1064022 [Mycena rosella]